MVVGGAWAISCVLFSSRNPGKYVLYLLQSRIIHACDRCFWGYCWCHGCILCDVPTGTDSDIDPDLHISMVCRTASIPVSGVVVLASTLLRNGGPGAPCIWRWGCVVGTCRGFYRWGLVGFFFQATLRISTHWYFLYNLYYVFRNNR